MKKTSEPIIFFGSGPVAAKSLAYLAKRFTIEAVITKPRSQHHKGEVPVIDLVNRLGFEFFTAENNERLDELFNDHKFMSRLGVIVDYGVIVSRKVIDSFPLGIVNSHFSLLPEWRGADPITFAILSGQSRTGVSLMLIVEKLDEGPLLAQSAFDIPDEYTTPQLTESLIELSNKSLENIIPLWLHGKIDAGPQEQVSIADSMKPTYSRKISKNDGTLDWTKKAANLEREIRAYIDWPKSRTILAGKEIIITKAHVEHNMQNKIKPGTLNVDPGSNVLRIATADGWLCIDRLKPAGKTDMTAKEFILGYKNILNY
jgi:methionyl-tRNA formyltransferase